MAVSLYQASFAAGELSPSLYGRVDLGKFAIGLSTARNGYISYRGGFYSRPGTSFCGFSKQTGRTVPPRMITFQFSINQGLALEWGNFYMRVVSNGAFVTETATTITGITNANPGVVTDTAHGYSNGDWLFFSGIGGMTQLNGKTLIAANVTANTYTLTDVYGTAVNTTSYGVYTSGGSSSRIFTLTTPYAEADLSSLKLTQSADVMSLTCWNQSTGSAYPPYDLARLSDSDWVLTELSVGSPIEAPASCSGVATVIAKPGGSPPTLDTDYQYVVTAVDSATGEESIASPIADIPNSVDIAITAGSIKLNWSAVAGARYYNIYKALPAYNATVPDGSLFGYVGSAFGTNFVDSNIVADYSQVPPLHFDPFAGGSIENVVITNGGSSLSAVTWSVITSTGSGFEGQPIISGNQLVAFNITDPGRDYKPSDQIIFNGGGFATGDIDFGATNPSAADTITLDGTVWTFVSGTPGSYQTKIGAGLASTMAQLASDLTASNDPTIQLCVYVASDSAIEIQYKTAGAEGNSFTLAASVATPSGAVLTGGTGGGGSKATGYYLFNAGNPTNGKTIILNGITWTFVTGIPSGPQTQIQSNLFSTILELASDLNSSVNPFIDVASYVANVVGSNSYLRITYKTNGTAGNSYTLALGTYGGSVSNSTLTGGTNGSGSGPAGLLVVGSLSGHSPSVVSYFQQRRVYAGSPNGPDTYWMSQPGAFKNFDYRIPTIDSDAITGTPWSVQVDGIQFMVPMPGGLVVLTGSSAWQLTGSGGSSLNPQPITPASQQAQPQAYNGCNERIPPIKISYDVLYVQAKGYVLRDLSYNFFTNIYTGADLTFLATQLFTGFQILEMAWCEEPNRLIWVTRDDGNLLSLTYLKEQEVMGWARHDTNGQFWSVCSVTEPPVDAPYFATQRYPGGKNAYMVERMDNRIWPALENAWCVDAGLTIDLPTPNATLTASSATGAGIPTSVTGLVGGSAYSPSTTATLQDQEGNGSGAVVNLTIAGGAITAISFTGGSGYVYPLLIFNDPDGTGRDASAFVVLNNSATFTASAAVFSIGQVGQVIRIGGGVATVTAYTDPTHVTGNITQPIVNIVANSTGLPQPADAGEWSIAPNVTTLSGLDHLIGATVTGLADGNVITPRTVNAQGQITLDTPASLVTVGLGFQVQMQSLYLGGGEPAIQGKRKKVAQVTLRLQTSNVGTLQVGCNQPDGSALSPPQNAPQWSNLAPVQVAQNSNLPPYGSSTAPLYTGDTLAIPVVGGFGKPGQVAVQQNSPVPLQVLALIPDVLPGDDPEAKIVPDEKPFFQRRK